MVGSWLRILGLGNRVQRMVPDPTLPDPWAPGLGVTVVAMSKVQQVGPQQPHNRFRCRDVYLDLLDS